MRYVVVGLGGIGSHLVDFLARYLEFSSDGAELLLVDGDNIELKNFSRQSYNSIGQSKCYYKYKLLMRLYPKLNVAYIDRYIDENNVKSILQENDTVFLCVDNHKSRSIVSTHCNNLKNVLLISGGNGFTEGNVQIYKRVDNKKVTPSLTDFHPEILDVEDHPLDNSCERSYNSEPQLIFTNIMIATMMLSCFYAILNSGWISSDIFFSMDTMKMQPRNYKNHSSARNSERKEFENV